MVTKSSWVERSTRQPSIPDTFARSENSFILRRIRRDVIKSAIYPTLPPNNDSWASRISKSHLLFIMVYERHRGRATRVKELASREVEVQETPFKPVSSALVSILWGYHPGKILFAELRALISVVATEYRKEAVLALEATLLADVSRLEDSALGWASSIPVESLLVVLSKILALVIYTLVKDSIEALAWFFVYECRILGCVVIATCVVIGLEVLKIGSDHTNANTLIKSRSHHNSILNPLSKHIKIPSYIIGYDKLLESLLNKI